MSANANSRRSILIVTVPRYRADIPVGMLRSICRATRLERRYNNVLKYGRGRALMDSNSG
jgi:hypothetical protein